MPRRRFLLSSALALGLVASPAVSAQAASAAGPDKPLFAVEFRLGPRWDAARPVHEQLHFREHSANLKRLREEGLLRVGARYADKGFIIIAAASEQEVRREIDKDASVQAQVFAYEVHAFQVFYPGALNVVKRPAGP